MDRGALTAETYLARTRVERRFQKMGAHSDDVGPVANRPVTVAAQFVGGGVEWNKTLLVKLFAMNCIARHVESFIRNITGM
jgi:hypothetical protein